jgi:Tfp pilus assembly protein PilN
MRPVNMLPPELRPRIPGEGDPRIAWGIIGALGLIFVMVVFSITLSNKAKTLNDEANAMSAEAQKRQAAAAIVPTKTDDVTDQVKTRTLLVGGLSAVRFPWNVAMRDLSKSLPKDVTLDSIAAVSAAPIDAAQASGAPSAGGATMQPQLTLGGCASGWVGYSRLMTWLRQMPGVASVRSSSSAVEETKTETASSGEEEDQSATRSENCGPAPLRFSLVVTYRPKSADLLGLPRPQVAAGATGATGGAAATTSTGTPAASTGG